MISKTLKNTALYSILFFSVHIAICTLFFPSFQITTVFLIHFFYFLGLFSACYYALAQFKKSQEKLWVAYLSIITVKFFISLVFFYVVKEVFAIRKIEALVHLFLWFFIYLLVEVVLIIKSIGIKETKNTSN